MSEFHPARESKQVSISPIRIPGHPKPYDPLVWEDRPKEVQDKGEVGHRPRDEPVEFGRTAPRLYRW